MLHSHPCAPGIPSTSWPSRRRRCRRRSPRSRVGDPGRGPDLLHVTLISLYDLHYAPPEWLPAIIAALDGFAAAPFSLRFDRIENRKTVTLRTRGALAEARAFQKALVNHLLREKAPIMDGTTPEPHITINYRGDRLNAQKMPPIGWTVDEIS
ncbi:2'-5' RNA ligase family protein [Sphingopyxis sp. H050]|uniref:2'-5' RNA ligase family protein n=1 Tax=Sphingopyxis sp. H050 TaxID=1759072 RepID=UPI0022B1E5C3|nr:2'-5' RNA ligase family protein [Sphingopyxis sp. H050]